MRGDGDLARAWVEYYTRMGVRAFHLVVHGPIEETAALLELRREFPISVRDTYGGEFLAPEVRRRKNEMVAALRDRWVLVVDIDEFVELPHDDVGATIRALEAHGQTALYAPMLQRLRADGGLESPAAIVDPSSTFPLCSIDLYTRLGEQAELSKHPLIYSQAGTEYRDGGHHYAPSGAVVDAELFRGVTHHYKWRGSAMASLIDRAAGADHFQYVYAAWLGYIRQHGRLPAEGAFRYGRRELFARRMLRRPSLPQRGWTRIEPAVDRLSPAWQWRLERAYWRAASRILA